jgi:protein SCO1/2
MSGVTHVARTGQERTLKRSRWGLALAALTLAAALASVFWLHQRAAPVIGGPFTLTNAATGLEVSDRDFRGKWLLVFFGYTHCPDICPTTLGNIAASLAQLGPLAARVQPLFITLDPDRDTRQVLMDYTSAFDPGSSGFPAVQSKSRPPPRPIASIMQSGSSATTTPWITSPRSM